MNAALEKLIAKIIGQAEFKKLLWVNPNPATAFAAQTVRLDLSDYDEVELFIAGNASTHSTTTQGFKLIIGKGGLLSISANVIWWRYVTPTVNGIEFGIGYQTPSYGANGTVNNALMVPYKIYGIKYVGGVVHRLLNTLQSLTYRRAVIV